MAFEWVNGVHGLDRPYIILSLVPKLGTNNKDKWKIFKHQPETLEEAFSMAVSISINLETMIRLRMHNTNRLFWNGRDVTDLFKQLFVGFEDISHYWMGDN